VSRIKSRLPDCLVLLTKLGFKIVDQSEVCVDGEELNFLRRVYARACKDAPHIVNKSDA
jgi:hypothetical protein